MCDRETASEPRRVVAHLDGAACGGNTFYTPGALRTLALDGQACKRCLASLAKADRAFRAKARARFGDVGGFARSLYLDMGRDAAARAIAAEEGTCLHSERMHTLRPWTTT